MNKELGDHIAKLNENAANIAKQFRNSALAQFSVQIGEAIASQRAALNKINVEIGGALQAFNARIQEQVKLQLPELKAFAENLKRFPQRIQKPLEVMSEHGWFMDGEMTVTDMTQFAELVDAGKVADANALLVAYFDERAPSICQELAVKFPERANAINQAFQAHANQQYFLSIPVLLSQADGIFKEACNYSVYKVDTIKGGGGAVEARTAQYVMDQVAQDTVLAAFLSPLKTVTPLLESHSDPLNTQFDQLNRHAVLHGYDVNYGTQANSLKAISWFNYVAFALRDEDDQTQATSQPTAT